MTMKNVELIASYWTIAGGAVPHAGPEYSAWDFRDRVAAIARAGFKGMGWWHADVEHTLEKYTHNQISQILTDNGLEYLELEFVIDWFATGDSRKASDRRRKLLLNTAEKLGARHIKIGNFVDQPAPMDLLVEEFARLCTEAADAGTSIVFELIPWVTPGTLDDALTMVRTAAAANGGLMLDLWHLHSLQVPNSEIAKLPLQYVRGVELNDGPALLANDGTWVDKTVNHRQLCGNGVFDIRGFIQALDRLGYTGPVGLEVLNKDMRDSWSLEDTVTKSYASTMAQFKQ
jgi:sugar phosphate isomerase/epimerase